MYMSLEMRTYQWKRRRLLVHSRYGGRVQMSEKMLSTRNTTINNSSAAPAYNSAVEQTQADAEWEPENASQDPKNAEASCSDMTALLQTDHLRVVRGKWRADNVSSCLMLVVVWSTTAHCIRLLRRRKSRRVVRVLCI